ncbi:kinase-like domain-containing protein [Aspergillus unguis]
MNHPVILYPPGTRRPMVAFGSAGMICRNSSNDVEVLKSPLRHDLSRCSEDTVMHMKEEEAFSLACIHREKAIFGMLPKHDNVIECLGITDSGIRLQYMHNGNLRDYTRKNHAQLDDRTKETWVRNAVSAVEFIHQHSVIHGDISARNFLVADDLSIKLCDFAGSGIGDMPADVEEEDRYRISPESPRSIQTDLFALGCLIFEITVGLRPYEEINDEEWEQIAEKYERGIFPPTEGLKYGDIIHKCWTMQYKAANELFLDIEAESNRYAWQNC